MAEQPFLHHTGPAQSEAGPRADKRPGSGSVNIATATARLSEVDRMALVEIEGLRKLISENHRDLENSGGAMTVIANHYLTELAEESNGGASFLLGSDYKNRFFSLNDSDTVDDDGGRLKPLQLSHAVKEDTYEAKLAAASMASEAAKLATLEEDFLRRRSKEKESHTNIALAASSLVI